MNILPDSDSADPPDGPQQSSGTLDVATRRDIRTKLSAVDSSDPLLICLSILSTHFGTPQSPAALLAGLPYTQDTLAPEHLVAIAAHHKFTARIMRRAELQTISPHALPCILLLENGNACIFYRSDGRWAEVGWPEHDGKRTWIKLAALQRQYQKLAIFIRPKNRAETTPEDVAEPVPSVTQSNQILGKHWLLGTFGQFLPLYGHLLLASIMVNSFALATPLFIMNVYDRVIPNDAKETLWVLAAGLAAVLLFELLVRVLRAYFVDLIGRGTDILIGSKLMQAIVAMRMDDRLVLTSTLASVLEEFQHAREFFTSSLMTALIDLPFAIMFLLLIGFIAGDVVWVPVIAMVLVMLINIVAQIPLRRYLQKGSQEAAERQLFLIDSLGALETVKALNAGSWIQRRWENLMARVSETSRKSRGVLAMTTALTYWAAQMTTLSVVVVGVYQVTAGAMTVGALVACTILVGRAMAPLGSSAALITRLLQSWRSLQALDNVMNRPSEAPAGLTFNDLNRARGDICFQNATFTYPAQKVAALQDIDLTIRAGDKIGIIGNVGSGKSTLAKLLLSLYQPSDGTITLDDRELRQFHPADLRRNIGYVGQDITLFSGSIYDNICFGTHGADEAAVKAAAMLGGVMDFAARDPAGLDRDVGERGQYLSGGQRQAIAIARAVLKQPPILLLDEPTSMMDRTAEMRFLQRLQQVRQDYTLIVITHRQSLLDVVDRLVVLDRSRIVADGPKQQILQDLARGTIHRAPATLPAAAQNKGEETA